MKQKLKYIGKFFIGAFLIPVSVVLLCILLPWGIIEILISTFWKKRFIKGLSSLGEVFLMIATLVDVMGNVVMKIPMNRILTVDGAYKFGSRFDTISYVLGHALVHDKLTKIGKIVCYILDNLDMDHCKKTYYRRQPT